MTDATDFVDELTNREVTLARVAIEGAGQQCIDLGCTASESLKGLSRGANAANSQHFAFKAFTRFSVKRTGSF